MPFLDGLGERRSGKDPQGGAVEVLSLRRELAAVPSFEFALRERISRLATFRHPAYARIHGIERASSPDQSLTIVSEEVPGIRLSEFLSAAEARAFPIDIGAGLGLIRQLAPAVAMLHATVRDAAHGALAAERLVLGPNGRLQIVEYVLASALEQLLFSRERYWTELRIALPRMAGLARFDHLADVTALGVVTLSVILGRCLRDDEYPGPVGDIVRDARAVSASGDSEPLHPAIKTWLERALQLDPRSSFPSAIEARSALEKAIAESRYDASADSVERMLARYHGKKSPAPRVPAPLAPAVTSVTTTASLIGGVTMAATEGAAVTTDSRESARDAAAPSGQMLTSVQADLDRLDPPEAVLFAAREAAIMNALHKSAPTSAPPARTDAVERRTADDDRVPETVVPAQGSRRWLLTAAAIAAVVLLGGATLAARRYFAEQPINPPVVTGTLAISTEPPGAEASVDGALRGSTPLTLTLPSGPHRVELRGRYGDVRSIPVTITAGAEVAQYVELSQQILALPAVDSAVATLPAPAAVEAGPVAGWISLKTRFDLLVYENGQLLGSSETERIMVPAGKHDLELVGDGVGYRSSRSVQVAAGKVATIGIEAPSGTLAINAIPWAEVWVDGEKIGETPIGNLLLPIGSHEIVFRHPELGEHRRPALVTLKSATRISADLRKK